MQIRNRVGCRDRLSHGIAPARLGCQCASSPRTVVGTDPGEFGNIGEHDRPGFLGIPYTPDIRAVALTGYEHDRRRTGAAALHIDLTTSANVDQPGKVFVSRGMGRLRAWRGGE